MPEFNVILRKKKDASYRAHLLGAVWIKDVSEHPVWAAWAQTSGLVRPITAAVRTGATFATPGASISWPLRDGPKMFHLSVCRDGGDEPDHVRTVAYFRDLCDPDPPSRREDGVVRFLVVPPLRLTPITDADIAYAAAAHFGVDLDSFGEFWAGAWDAYAALTTLYLRSRTRSPILPGRVPRSVMLAAAVRYGLASWVCPYERHPPRRHCCVQSYGKEFDLTGIGYSPALYFSATDDDVDRLCRVVPMIISRRYGRDYLTGDDVPPDFLDFDIADSKELEAEVAQWLV